MPEHPETAVKRAPGRTVVVDGGGLTVQDVVDVATGQAAAALGPGVPARMQASLRTITAAVEGDAAVYGVNTGFGALADTAVTGSDLDELQLAIIRSHAAGTGEPLDDATTRAMLLLRARTLAAGYSGVRPELPEMLIEFLNRGLLPVVPAKGSVGASGDLAQLAHLAQPLIGEGRLRRSRGAARGGGTAEGSAGDGAADGSLAGRLAAEVLAEEGLQPLRLAPKEGLALVNGTEPMQALLTFAVHDAVMLVRAADVACALSVEALLGTDRPYDERVQALRPHPGQLASAANLRALLAGSELMASHRHSRHAVQDAYCLRCAPQVHGAVRDVLGHAEQVVSIELASVVDNPVIVPDGAVPDGTGGPGGTVMTTGNFHGEPLAFAADMLAIALAELASISERRVDRMLDPAFSRGLPPFLAPQAGTNSGFMLAQYTAASLVSENKVLAHPASVDTIPTSGKQEDHVSMGWTAVRKLREVVSNVRTCLAIEICCAAQGLDLRAAGSGPALPPPAGPLRAVHAAIRSRVPAMYTDREVAEQLTAVSQLLPDLCKTASAQCGGLR
jgi:histidine ammonia-lyase